jgi:hypothetical protein
MVLPYLQANLGFFIGQILKLRDFMVLTGKPQNLNKKKGQKLLLLRGHKVLGLGM